MDIGTSRQSMSAVALNKLNIKFRHVDTAEMYGNEEGVGEAVRNSGLKREEIFVSKSYIQ
jgi:2,5-diketo-D-gluconate reductase A